MSYDTWKTTEPDAPTDPDALEAWSGSCEQARAVAALEVRYQTARLTWLDTDTSRRAYRLTKDDHAAVDTLTDGFWLTRPPHVRQLLQTLWADRCDRW